MSLLVCPFASPYFLTIQPRTCIMSCFSGKNDCIYISFHVHNIVIWEHKYKLKLNESFICVLYMLHDYTIYLNSRISSIILSHYTYQMCTCYLHPYTIYKTYVYRIYKWHNHHSASKLPMMVFGMRCNHIYQATTTTKNDICHQKKKLYPTKIHVYSSSNKCCSRWHFANAIHKGEVKMNSSVCFNPHFPFLMLSTHIHVTFNAGFVYLIPNSTLHMHIDQRMWIWTLVEFKISTYNHFSMAIYQLRCRHLVVLLVSI